MANILTKVILVFLRLSITFSLASVANVPAGLFRNLPSSASQGNEIECYYPEGNGLFILYYGGSIDANTKRPSQETLDSMRRLWKLKPNFVVVGEGLEGSPEIVDIFHKSDANHNKVTVLAYVIMTDEACEKLRPEKEIDDLSRLAMKSGYDGIFFDCARQDPEKYPNIHDWNSARVKEAKKNGNKLIIMNPGEALVDSRMFGYADIVCVENQYDKRPTAFVRRLGTAPEDSEKVNVAQWRWLAAQGDPQTAAAHDAKESLDRLRTFRANGGCWYYSSFYKKGKGSTAIELPDWLEEFSEQVTHMEDCPCKKGLTLPKKGVKVVEGSGVYHGAFPEFGETEDVVTPQAIQELESSVGKSIAWAYFSNNWFVEDDKGKTRPEIRFPCKAVLTIWNYRKQHRIVPFIRMMPRSTWKKNAPDPVYKMQSIIDGKFDTSLREWARAARDLNFDEDLDNRIPLMVEFGAEVNGDWFPWNGKHNGGSSAKKYGDPKLADGPERYRDAYRHIIDLFRAEGVDNITWVFHVDSQASPEESWNNMAAYYPGDQYIDWIGASVYGPAQSSDSYKTFKESFESQNAYNELSKVSGAKPMAVLEFGVNDIPQKPDWISEALVAIKKSFPRIKAISYWNSSERNDDGSVTRFKLEGESLRRYKAGINDPIFLAEVVLNYKS